MASKSDSASGRYDEAARAGWLYYVAGNTQEEIAQKLGVSRQSAQRLVSLAISERLIKVRLDHPIARCMELAHQLKDCFHLQFCEVVPSDPDASNAIAGLAQAGGAEIERHFKSQTGKIIGIGTGRILRACVEEVTPMDCPQHRVVSLLGNMMSDGSASAYNVVTRLADRVKARHFPMPLPVVARSPEEKALLHQQVAVRNILDLAHQADITFVGIGSVGEDGPLRVDGFVTPEEMRATVAAGGVGEIASWVYDKDGVVMDGPLNDRVTSAPLIPGSSNPVIGIAARISKINAIRAAMRGKLINGLITNELTAERLLALQTTSG